MPRMHSGFAYALLLIAAGCASTPPKHPYRSAGIDHILIGAPTLDEGIRAFEKATGVTPLRGGKHPLRGTENALASLGNGAYVEIIAPQKDAKPNETVTALRGLRAPAVFGWAVHVVDADAAAALLQRAGFKTSKPQPGSRITPDGGKLEWVTFNLTEPHFDSAPFFIQWGESTTHPSLTSPGGCALKAFEVGDPRSDDLMRLLSVLGVRVEVRASDQPDMHLALRCGAHDVSFDSP